MNPTPSLRRMWTLYKKLLVEDGMSRRDQVLAQSAFYSGARGVLRMLGHILEDGDVDELHRVIRKHGRTIWVLQGQRPRKRRHCDEAPTQRRRCTARDRTMIETLP